MDNNSSSTQFSFVAIGKIITISLQAIFYLFFAAILGPEPYGQLSVIIALAGTFSIISRFGLPISLQVFQANEKFVVAEQIITAFIISTTIASLVLLFIEPLAAALCASMSLFFMYQQKLMGSRLYKKFMLNSILKSSTFLVFPLLLFFIFEIPGILLGMIISNFVSSIPLYSTIKLKISFSGLQKYYKILIHNFAADVSGSLSLMIDKLLIASLFGFFIVGIYQFNTQILIALGTLPGILGSYLISEMAHGSNHKVISLLTFLLSVMITVVGIVTAPFFINTLFPGYSEGIFSLQILLITIIPQTIGTIFGSSLLAKGSTKLGFIAIIKIGSLLPLFVYFGNIFGLVGLSLAFLISIILSTLVTYFVYKYGGNDKIFDNNTLEDLP